MGLNYSVTVSHRGLNRYRVIKGSSRWEVEQRATAQERAWNALYARQQEVSQRRRAKELQHQALEQAQESARERTEEAQADLEAIRNTLKLALKRKLSFSWDAKKNLAPYFKPEPQVVYLSYPKEPQQADPQFVPDIGFLDKMVTSFRDKKVLAAQEKFQSAVTAWQEACARIQAQNDHLYTTYSAEYEQWTHAKAAYEQGRANFNAALDLKKERYAAGSAPEVVEYCRSILNQSQYPEFFDKNFDLEYNTVRKILVVDYDLPTFDDLPRLKEVKYVKSKDEFVESTISVAEANRMYSDFLYQICLRTIHELFVADIVGVLATVAFNGNVSAINPATGKVDEACILAVAVDKKSLVDINLAQVDPEECFKGLGGRSSGKLSDYRPVTFYTTNDPSIGCEAPLPAWADALKQRIQSENRAVVFRVSDLQKHVGVVPGARAKLSDSKALIELLNEAGMTIEPHAQAMAQAYRPEDTVAVFLTESEEDCTPSEKYKGAVAVLAMCGIVATVDGTLDTQEADLIQQYVEEAFQFSASDRTRNEAALATLLVNNGYFLRSLPKIVQRLPSEQREWAAEVATYIGTKAGTISERERGALEKIYQAIGLPAETQQAVLAKFVTPIESIVAEAEPQEVGEPIVTAVTKTLPAFSLDLSRIAAISKETREVVELLSGVMMDKESKVEEKVAAAETAPTNGDQSAAGLDPVYLPAYNELLTKAQWPRVDFNAVAAKYNLMPVALTDVINSWSDEVLGDFLIEGEDPIIIHTELV